MVVVYSQILEYELTDGIAYVTMKLMEITVHKPKYNVEVQNKIKDVLQLFADGTTLFEATSKCGLSLSQFYSFCKEDAFLKDIFLEAKELNRSVIKDTLTNVIYNSALIKPDDAKWLLERMFPEEFGKNSTLNVNTPTDDTNHFIDITRFVKTDKDHVDAIN